MHLRQTLVTALAAGSLVLYCGAVFAQPDRNRDHGDQQRSQQRDHHDRRDMRGDHHDRRDMHGDRRHDARADRRHDLRDHRRDDRYRGGDWRRGDDRRGGDWRRGDDRRAGEWRGRGAGPDHDWYRGGRLPPQYRGHQYVVDNWRAHRLSAPPRGYHWVQAGSDYVLVAIATGVIASILLSQ
jgi:Ni/Co efflux regulator RcnB